MMVRSPSDAGPGVPASGPAAGADDVDLEVVARLRVVIARLGRQLRRQAGQSLSPTLQSVLASIAVHGPLSLSELAAREQVAPPTVTKLLAKLDEQGLIERQRAERDRRITLVSLTPAGEERFEESRTRRTAWLVRRLAELDGHDLVGLEQVVELLEAIARPGAADEVPALDPLSPRAQVS